MSAPPLRTKRWNSSKVLREKWLAPIEGSLCRPVLLVDEAQEMNSTLFCELRLLSSAEVDSRSILTIVLCGDQRLAGRLESSELLPVASRIRIRSRRQASRIIKGWIRDLSNSRTEGF